MKETTEVYPGSDGKVRAVRLRAWKFYLQQAIQYLHLLGLSCRFIAPTQEHTMNAAAEEFRPKINANKIARVMINNLTINDREGTVNE